MLNYLPGISNNINNYTAYMKKLNINDRIFLKHSNQFDFVKVSQIKLITSMGNYCSIRTDNTKSIIIRNTLTRLEEALPEENFLRINRSTIVNLDSISKISRESSGRYKINVENIKEELVVSQRYAVKIKKQLSFG